VWIQLIRKYVRYYTIVNGITMEFVINIFIILILTRELYLVKKGLNHYE